MWKALKLLSASSRLGLLEMCNRSSYASTSQPAEFLIENALKIARRERGAAGICEKNYASQKTLIFEEQRANYV